MRRTNRDLLETRFSRTARIISDRYDIEVIHEGDKVCTDGRKIYLPVIPEDMSEELMIEFEAYIDHETAHLLFSDFRALKSVPDELTNTYVQLCEDLRIEGPNCMRRVWRGTGRSFDQARRSLYRKDVFQGWSDMSEATRLWCACFLVGSDDEELLSEAPDDEVFKRAKKVSQLLLKAKDMPSSFYSVALGQAVVRALGISPETTETPKEDPLQELVEELLQEFEASQEEGGVGEEEELPASEEEEKEKSDSEGEKGEKEKGEKKEEKEEKGEEDKEGKDEEGVTPDINLRVRRLEREVSKEKKEAHKHKYMPYSTKDDKISIARDGCKVWFKKAQIESRKTAGVMTRRLRMSLAHNKRNTTHRGKETGLLSPPDLPRFLTRQDPRVFKQIRKGQDMNTRISLLVDVSGSMCGSKITEARKAIVTFGEFCHAINLPFEILSFTTTCFKLPHERYAESSFEDQRTYSRWGALEVTIYKEFHENWRSVGHRVKHIRSRNHNYDGEAVLLAAQRLIRASKPGERLVQMVFSDGLPEQAISCCSLAHRNHLLDVVKKVSNAGICLVGIGIQTTAVKKFYKDHVVIDNATELTGVQLNKLKEILIKDKGMRKRS